MMKLELTLGSLQLKARGWLAVVLGAGIVVAVVASGVRLCLRL